MEGFITYLIRFWNGSGDTQEMWVFTHLDSVLRMVRVIDEVTGDRFGWTILKVHRKDQQWGIGLRKSITHCSSMSDGAKLLWMDEDSFSDQLMKELELR